MRFEGDSSVISPTPKGSSSPPRSLEEVRKYSSPLLPMRHVKIRLNSILLFFNPEGWDRANAPNQRGLAAFGYRQMLCWLDELKSTIAKNIPAILLMEFGDVPNDGTR